MGPERDNAVGLVEIVIQAQAGASVRRMDSGELPFRLTGGKDLPSAGIIEEGVERVGGYD